jgi:hypothetical protein
VFKINLPDIVSDFHCFHIRSSCLIIVIRRYILLYTYILLCILVICRNGIFIIYEIIVSANAISSILFILVRVLTTWSVAESV